jgi:hypothetical protein
MYLDFWGINSKIFLLGTENYARRFRSEMVVLMYCSRATTPVRICVEEKNSFMP